MKLYVALSLLLILATSCHSYTCRDLTDRYSSSEEKIERIKGSTFRFTDEFKLSDTSSAWTSEVMSWITSANYYSCDGEKGYLIFNVSRGSTYVRNEIPIGIWKGLKETSAKWDYYDRHIKDKYHSGTIVIKHQISN